jgi:hypothetical protein
LNFSARSSAFRAFFLRGFAFGRIRPFEPANFFADVRAALATIAQGFRQYSFDIPQFFDPIADFLMPLAHEHQYFLTWLFGGKGDVQKRLNVVKTQARRLSGSNELQALEC